MPIDLSRFTEEKVIIAPVISGACVYGGRRLSFQGLIDSWYRIILGSSYRADRQATLLEVRKITEKQKLLMGFPLGGEVIPFSFESFHRLGLGESAPVYFMNAQTFNMVGIFRLEDKNFYFGQQFPPMFVLRELRKAFTSEQPIGSIKGVTPEMRYYFLLLTLQRQSYRELEALEKMNLAKEERDKRIKEFENSFAGRLKKTVEDAGGHLISFEKTSATRYLVTWKTGNQIVKSTINDSFKIYTLGYCASGADRKYFLDSAIQLAKTFQERSPLHITHF